MLRFARPALALALILTAALGFFASRAEFDFTVESLFEARSAELRQFRDFTARFGDDDGSIFVAFTVADVFEPRALERIDRLAKELAAAPGVRRTYSPAEIAQALSSLRVPSKLVRRVILESPLFGGVSVSPDGRTTVIQVELAPDVRSDRDRAAVLAAMRPMLDAAARDLGTSFHLAGIPIVEQEYVRLTKRDLMTFMPTAIAIFTCLLALYFRNFIGTFLPLAVVSVAVVWTVAGLTLAGRPIGVLTSIVPNLILIIGLSDTIHILSRYQEDLAARPDKRAALAATLGVMVVPCFLTSFTSAAGFASLAVTNVQVVVEFGVVSAAGIMAAYAATMLIVPGALDVAAPLRGRVGARSGPILDFVARVNDRGRWLLVAVWTIVIGLCVWGMTKIERNADWLQDIRAQSEVTEAHAFVERNLASVFSVDLDLVAPDFRDPAVLAELEAFESTIRTYVRGSTKVTAVVGPADLAKEATYLRALANPLTALWAKRRLPATRAEADAAVATAEKSDASRAVLRRLVSEDFTHARVSVRLANLDARQLEAFGAWVSAVPRERFAMTITGKSWLAMKALDGVVVNMMSSVFLAAAIIFGSMGVMFRSLKIGLLSVIPNLVPLLVTAGLMGFLGIDLNFTTVTVFSISLGLAVDNTIHYLARHRLEVAAGGEPVEAMRRAIRGAGRPMVFSTMLLILGFGAILTSNFRFTFHFGLLGGATVLAALLADLFLTPALMMLVDFPIRENRAAARDSNTLT